MAACPSTSEGGAAAKFFHRSMRAHQVDSASERIKLGQDRARAGSGPDSLRDCRCYWNCRGAPTHFLRH